jgi:hypothetical protein
MSEDAAKAGRAEGKAWVAAASEAMNYYFEHGPEDAMTSAQRQHWDQLVAAAQEAADGHDEARDS